MSFLDSIGRVFSGSMKWTYLEPDLTGQGVLGVYAAAERRGGISLSGGRLVLTNQALIFCPMDLAQAKKAVDLVITAGQIPGGDLISKFASLGRDSVLAVPLANIATVEQTSTARVASPPSICVTTKVGSKYDFGVLAGPGYPNLAPKNNEAVADLLAKLRPLLTA